MDINELDPSKYNNFAVRYIDKVPAQTNLIDGLKASHKEMVDFYGALADDKWEYKYAPEKWTIKEIFQHLVDTERIFAYRMLRIARGDKTPLAGFDQNDYVVPSKANAKSKETLFAEFEATRQFTLSILGSLDTEDLAQIGTASDLPISARAIGFFLIGHATWHKEVIQERYL